MALRSAPATWTRLGLLAAVLLAGLVWWQQGGVDEQAGPATGLPEVAASELPPEARGTLELIDAGGPYRYDQDDSVFRNRERLLPDRPEGYYREYTVPTPGSEDRGARRIVAGAEGERYWTDDHYASFSRILR